VGPNIISVLGIHTTDSIAATNLVVRDALDIIRPATGKLDGSLDSLDASVHGQHALIPKVLRQELGVLAQCVVMEGARGERDLLGLRERRCDQINVSEFKIGPYLLDKSINDLGV
jgi:hypothetical protein